jgi:hypothetical protein
MTFTGTYSGPIAPVSGYLDATLPSLVANLAGTATPPTYTGTLAAALQPVEGQIYGRYYGLVGTDTSNQFSGRRRSGDVGAIVEIVPPVDAPPFAVLGPPRVDKAIAFPPPTIVDGIPVWDQSAINTVVAEAGVDRVLLGGRDFTWFRATRPDHQPTRVPSYTLTDPYGYGGSRPLVIPRVAGYFEEFGTGDLKGVVPGAEVAYQRVYPNDGGRIETDYRGVVVGRHPSASSVEVGGELTARAATIHRPGPVVRLVRDVGHWVWLALGELSIPMTPRRGPITGIMLPDGGDMDGKAWLDNLHAMSQTRAGTRRTLMPVAWGKRLYQFVTRDTTTVHYTIFADGTRVTLELYDDAAEQPNTWWASGTGPDGVRWRNVKMPGYFDAEPPGYPIPGGANFGIGTTNADTITGDGITVLWSKLVALGDLPGDDNFNGVYDQDIYDAVHDLKTRAGLSDNGTMTPAAWDAMFNVGDAGYTPNGSRQHPLLQDPTVRQYNYTSDGEFAGHNPRYNRLKLRVDRVVQFGNRFSKRAARNWIRGEQARTSTKNYAGTITLNQIGVFSGDHGVDDYASLTAADLVPLAAIRPGNARIPYFAGGIVVHISGIEVSEDRQSATLYVDTQARDLLEVQALITRNREAKRNPWREWWASNRASKKPGNYMERNELFGKLATTRTLNSNRWNVMPIPVGETGTINRVLLHVFDRPSEYAVAVFGHRLARTDQASERVLQRRVGDPFPVNGDGETVWDRPSLQDFFNQHGLLYYAGTEKQPLGYGTRDKFGPNGHRTKAPLTGVHLDDASWGFGTDSARDPVLFLAIYPRSRSKLRRGQVFWVQEDDVT